MKPINLTVSGLHSFREKQTVDFEALCSGGVFGIFGPTGSGKSSILDAITLALYGKVERAANNTQGILNHGENELKVSFTFELENASHKKRYTVERSFKRTDELRVKSASSRLIEIEDETYVLADKTNDVNQQVQELLGLTIDDFTRAVVLPQGKFAEFLSLKGTERRQMLQRLFNLEQYGDQLSKKIRYQVQQLKTDLDKITAEQTGLGEASTEKVTEAEQLVSDSIVLLEKREKEAADLQERYDQQASLWKAQQEKTLLEEKLVHASKQEEDIKQKQDLLTKAQQAERLFPYLKTFEQAEKQQKLYKDKVEKLKVQIVQQSEEYKRSNSLYEQARLQKNEQQPKLVVQKEQLQQASDLQKQIKDGQQEVKEAEVSLQQKQQALQTKNDELIEADKRYQQGLNLQKELKEALTKVEIQPDYRQAVQQAFYRYQVWNNDKKNLDEGQKTYKEKAEQLQHLHTQKQTHQERYQQTIERSKELFSDIQGLYHTVCEREKEFQQLFQQADHLMSDLKRRKEKEWSHRLAHQLAEQLTKGEPCPVCGSEHHPNPVLNQKEEDGTVESANQFEDQVNQLREQRFSYSSLKMQLEQLAKPLVEKIPDLAGFMNEAGQVPALGEMGTDAFGQYAKKIEVEIKSLEQDYLQVGEKQHAILGQVQKVQQSLEKIELELAHYQKEQAELERKVTQQKQALQAGREAFQQDYPSFVFEEMEKINEQLNEREKEEQTIKARIEKSSVFFENQQKKIERLKEEKYAGEKEFTELKAMLSHKQSLVHSQIERLRTLTDQEDIEQALQKTVHLLAELETNEQQAYQHWQTVQKAYQTLQMDEKAASESLETAHIQYKKAAGKWEEAIGNSLFSEEKEVQQALLSHDEMKLLDETVQAYWDNIKQMKSSIEQLNIQLNHQSIEEQQFEETQQLLHDIKAAVKEAVQLKGAAEQTLKSVKERHERFLVLEQDREEKQALFEQYQKLQTVFKGNAFVEYIAEEQLMSVSRDASERLGILTRQRYAIEVDSQGGFIMRDDANGGVKRPVSTLSGGETFLTSLALALSLSAQIQLRGEYPLQFFFLDEGFGTLDGELLDTVVTALEKLQSNNLSIGVISHVQELRARLPKRLIVEPSEPSGKGTSVRVETL
ncbi:SbcC/MukB-like Walker B domain-containing protein [Priestia aryabhattai]|uniref:SbcC/MukB-like Walker B domain-containing protein n=1 Tax=Priestia aryabhattai TaxID=412384 RepID=UPI0023B0F8C6|nr:SMC family ATPase [Priestia aryabhattai]MDE8675837.1 SMC family ATPase [Priestia aryabhattai]